MELLKFVRRRSFLSELVYTVLNIVFAVMLLLIIRYTDSIGLAIGLVALSKWRVFAVRPRYWWANVRSNLVDFIVSIGVVLQLHAINVATMADPQKLLLMVVLTALYVAWLLFLKPQSKRRYIALQAGVAVLFGTSALFAVSFNWPVSLVVIAMWVIGYTAARHVLSTYSDETHGLFLGLVWGVVFAEIGWVAYHWAIAYSLPIISGVMLPQASIIALLVSFVAFQAYDSFHHHAKIRMSDVLLPLLFSLSVIAVLLFVFNRVGTAL